MHTFVFGRDGGGGGTSNILKVLFVFEDNALFVCTRRWFLRNSISSQHLFDMADASFAMATGSPPV